MNEKTENLMDTILTMAGVACLMYPLIKQATKTLAPEVQKLTSGEALQDFKLLPPTQEKPEHKEPKEHKYHEKEPEEKQEHQKPKEHDRDEEYEQRECY